MRSDIMQLTTITAALGLAACAGFGIAEDVILNQTIATAPPPTTDRQPCDCLRWTRWVNADQVDGDGGDFESIGYNVRSENGLPGRVTRYLARLRVVCNSPVRVQCRHVRSQRPWYYGQDDTIARQRINCELNDGFVCTDAQQADGHCQDYEIRLLCWTECDLLRWGQWFDRDDPSGYCDCEVPGWTTSAAASAISCPDGGSPLEVDCRTTAGVHAALTSNVHLTCNVDDGFICWNSQQPSGTGCLDYKVRYLCGNPGP